MDEFEGSVTGFIASLAFVTLKVAGKGASLFLGTVTLSEFLHLVAALGECLGWYYARTYPAYLFRHRIPVSGSKRKRGNIKTRRTLRSVTTKASPKTNPVYNFCFREDDIQIRYSLKNANYDRLVDMHTVCVADYATIVYLLSSVF
ncbi:hypothetical protein L2E82_46126 [Cichorium intybus]|uniref:Uncharacterized protein n=1 Tax=Cichorium intybus TaxID=13427 RepID=A0ACB8YSP9_CICIN|nr:hypothetical protein L2E82_46126 [Cichorium intybus]